MMRHWAVTINFEAWDEEDAYRLARAMNSRATAESRLLFMEKVVETTEYRLPDVPGQLGDPRGEEFTRRAEA